MVYKGQSGQKTSFASHVVFMKPSNSLKFLVCAVLDVGINLAFRKTGEFVHRRCRAEVTCGDDSKPPEGMPCEGQP